jgi:hypothetical protein
MGLVLGAILSCVDLFLYFVSLGPVFTFFKLLKSSPKVKAIGPGTDAPRRRVTSKNDLLKSPYPEANVATLHDLMCHAANLFKDRPLFGTRTYLGEVPANPEKGQRFPPKHFGDTVWVTVR